MKNYFLLLAIIVFIIADVFVSNAIIANQNINKTFEGSGYILKYTNKDEKYYFSEEATYKKSYNDQIVFKNTEGEKIVVDKNNFIHYNDGSISSFTKGVLLDLDMIDTDPITYYNVSANKLLKKLSNNKYVTKNLNNEIQFTNLMWKISDSKYLLASDSMKLVFSDSTEKSINGFVEIEYTDNEIVKIFNKDVRYETISTEVYIQVGEDIKINLGTKIISKKGENEMTLENMVIDSNDNVTIIDMDEYKEENTENTENTENNTNGQNNGQGGNASSISNSNVIANGGTTVIDNNNDNENKGDNKETEIKNDLSVYTPKYIIREFEVNSTGVKVLVEIEDDEARLTTGTTTSIINNSTGKIAYSLPETGASEIKIDTAALEPNQEYTLIMEASYAVDNINYKKNFVYKVFRTPALGITLEKDLFTDETLSFYLNFEKDSPVTKLDVELLENGQKKQGILNTNGSTERIEFAELTPDTQYTIQIKNIFVDNISNEDTYSYTYRTLKSIPKLANGKTHCNVETEIDKWNSKFVLSIPNLKEGVVESLNYQIYTETEGQQTVVYNLTTSDTKIILPINDKIQRNKDYYCRVFATFYDNEKVIEYEIANTETSFNMNSSEMPSIRFETENENSITFNSIKGNIVIEDNGNTINPKTSKIEIIYNSTTKDVDDNGSKTYNGINENLSIPIELTELKSNETYKLSIYASYDLHDENGERYGYIGSIMITTKKPVPMKANWTPQENGIDINLKLSSTENSELEANSLYSFELALYLGQQGASKNPIAKAKLVDLGTNNFIASLKEEYCTDTGGIVTKDTFGLTDAQIDEIERTNKYCTIVISNAKDYVSRNKSKKFENDLPITSNTISYQIKTSGIRNPSSSTDAIKITQVTKERIKYASVSKVIPTKDYTSISEILSKSEINNTTPVAIKVEANISSIQLETFNYFEYFIYDSKGNEIATSGLLEKSLETGEVPSAMFLVSNGTNESLVDNGYIARGNDYYVKYYAYTNIDKADKYPTDIKEVDYWVEKGKPLISLYKQEPNVIMYPSTSNTGTITYKYKITDFDNTIIEEEGIKYFYEFCAETLLGKKAFTEGINSSDENGYWTVTFDQIEKKYINFNLEVKIRRSIQKGVTATYKSLISQKIEEIVNNFNIEPIIVENSGISSKILFENLDSSYKEKIAKVRIELIDKANEIPNTVIEKTYRELETLNWNIEVNYLDVIYKNTQSVKDKTFEINVIIYYTNGMIGYDLGGDYIAYKTITGQWLRIHEITKEFIRSEINVPIVHNSNKYIFDNDNVIIRDNEKEICWLNYSSNGLTRNVEELGEIAILPVKIVESNNKLTGSIELKNVVPGIVPSTDMKIISRPKSATIYINKLYNKDTIGTDDNIFIEVYDYNTNKVVTQSKVDMVNGTEFNNLQKGKRYYCKLYVSYNGEKYYLYDMDKNSNDVNYEFGTLDEVRVDSPNISYIKSSKTSKSIWIEHSANILNGYKGFLYEICDKNGNLINKPIEYSVDNVNFKTTNNGKFIINLEQFENVESKFKNIYINASRKTFFEYNTNYIFKITPLLTDTETIGTTVSKTFSYSPMMPEISIYARRVESVSGIDPYITFNVSILDDDDLIASEKFSYKIYENGYTTPVAQEELVTNNYITIRLSKETIGDSFDFEKTYKIEISYDRYLKNQTDTETETVTVDKELSKIENGLYIGTTSWNILNNAQIQLKFYGSYNLKNIKGIKCSIYDINGRILKNVPVTNDVYITDNTLDANDPHKAIIIQPNYIFENGKSYMISVRFLDENDKIIGSFEPENPVVNK